MKLVFSSSNLEDYLKEVIPTIQFNTPLVQQQIHQIQSQAPTDEERAKIAFEIARDEIHHSFDTKNPVVTINAEDVLLNKEGICFAKSHLLATLLRGMGIPTGFCYQRVLRNGKTLEGGHALHGLNAVYLKEYGWFRVDPRGNKPGIDSQFSIKEEKLAYPIREELGEMDYPNVFNEPLSSVIKSMLESKTSQDLFFNRPEFIE
ncbi:MAG TPA: transglutaminase family protein [Bacteroidia bacterium]|nr:transglutaminase family protein [Bacteroidia bacterium]QQR94487.1 MAG: transglutaminase family protein [Bacteroidota bacterium]MBP7714077.1 transglutaminase family protein [Bacteroidia bacterium]MBP8668445.1 transglutaminase family protein [Bacteroidia bacterium]HQW17129.1 transglutaminase family protein [Bacteroidia bacterium]